MLIRRGLSRSVPSYKRLATGRPNPSRETRFSGANGDRRKTCFPDKLTTSRIATHGLNHTLLNVLTIHTYSWCTTVLVPLGRRWHARGWWRCRGEPGRAPQTVQAYTLYRVSKHQIRRGRRAVRSLTSQGSAEPLCARIKSANREFLRGKLISDHGLFSSYESQRANNERRTGKIRF